MMPKHIRKTAYCMIVLLLFPLLFLPGSVSAGLEMTVGDGTEPDVYFSEVSGFYDRDFYLTLSSNMEDAVIYYTLDGSDPTEHSNIYTSPVLVYNRSGLPNRYRSIRQVARNYNSKPDVCTTVPVPKLFLIRARAVLPDGRMSVIRTASYFVGLSAYENSLVISLVSDPDNLFGPVNGIYVTGRTYQNWYESGKQGPEPLCNFEIRGDASAREGHAQFFLNGKLYTEQPVEIRLQGSTARGNVPKRFSLISRKELSGNAYFRKEFFEDTKTHSVVLHDNFENAIMYAVCAGRDALSLQGRKAYLFLDGEYWAPYYLMEKYSERFIEEKTGVDHDNIQLLKIGYIDEESKVLLEEYGWNDLISFVKENDMSIPENYEAFCGMVDVQSFIDFTAINVYAANMDYADDKNFCVWRSIEDDGSFYGDGRWRFALYDMELCAYDAAQQEGYPYNETYRLDSFTVQGAFVQHSIENGAIFRALSANEDFRRQFILSFMDIENTLFTEKRVEEAFGKFGIPADWNNGFFQKRKPYINGYLKTLFGIQGKEAEVRISVNDASRGTVRLNTAYPDLSAGDFSGSYFSGIPVTAEAIPAEGYRFVCWAGDSRSKDPCIEITVPDDGLFLRAIFKKDR